LKIAVVILNWNGKALLEKFLPSVVNFSKEATVYVADNASTDDSILLVNTLYPSVKIIQNTVNGGYAKGYNDALKHLNEDILVLLNSDVEVTEHWLKPILECFERNTNVAAVQPKILDYKKKSHFEYAGAAGGFIDVLGYPYCRGRIFNSLEEDYGQYNDTSEIFWASGACLAIRNDIFHKVGALDEDFFAHQEEIDLCWRIKNAGYSILYTGQSSVYHVGGATLSNMNPKKTFYNFRNTLFALIKNVAGPKVYAFILLRLILDGIAGFKFLIENKPKHFLAILKAHGSFYAQLPKFLNKRKALKSSIKYHKITSVVYQHFVLKKQSFKEL
jgi:hypothetical protein